MKAGFNEAEIQLLASLAKAELENLNSDEKSLEKSGHRYWIYLEDWGDAYSTLMDKELIEANEKNYRLTILGRPFALSFHQQRPDRYWYYYQKFYAAASESAAHSQLCKTVFGKDLCQEGMVDMTALDDLFSRLQINSNHHVLDLGCGVGVIAEYISDQTGCKVTGLDYSQSAIDIAQQRTSTKTDRLKFIYGDMNQLELPKHHYDAMISLDTLYWVDDLSKVLRIVGESIKPGGQMGIFMLNDGDTVDDRKAENSETGKALSVLSFDWEAFNYTQQNARFWRLMHRTASELLPVYRSEGNGFIAANLIKESEEDFLPEIETSRQSRYLFHVKLS